MKLITKPKRHEDIGIKETLLFALPFEFASAKAPREFTRSLSLLVRYPKLINDLGRSVDSLRKGEGIYAFEIRQKRYLGRGVYAISARAIGTVSHDEKTSMTVIRGYARLGGQYSLLLSLMTLATFASLIMLLVTILFLPILILMVLILALHWSYLFADRRDLLHCLDDLVQEREIQTDYDINQIESPHG
jgi:hypothetical protein